METYMWRGGVSVRPTGGRASCHSGLEPARTANAIANPSASPCAALVAAGQSRKQLAALRSLMSTDPNGTGPAEGADWGALEEQCRPVSMDALAQLAQLAQLASHSTA